MEICIKFKHISLCILYANSLLSSRQHFTSCLSESRMCFVSLLDRKILISF
uniref:Uncharacterized protein n=1 Tax=Rhizophora mucronata TaxID=61149 RepID=A0A2P2NXC5_RHIMU